MNAPSALPTSERAVGAADAASGERVMSDDRRGAFRRNAFTFGAVEAGGNVVGCLVWDINEGGALIEFEGALELPARIRLRLAPDAEMRDASVAWCRGNRAGVSFDG